MTKISNLYSLTNYITANSSGSISIAPPTSGFTLNVSGSSRFTGQLSGSNATFTSAVTASAFIPTGSAVPTNGMYLPAANTLAFATSGTVDMTLTSAGNVLINKVNDEGFRLDVSGTGRFSGALSGSSATFTGALSGSSALFTSNINISGSATSGLVLQNSAGGESPNVTFLTPVNRYNIDANAIGTLRFFTENIDGSGGVVRASIDSSGSVTFSSSVTASTFTSNVTSGVFLNNSSGGTNATQLRINNTSGDLRLGIESSTGATIQLGTLAYAAVLGNQANNALQFTTNGTARMTIAAGGNVGIGTTAPIERLDINSTMNLNGVGGCYASIQYNASTRGYWGTANAVIASGANNDFGISAISNLVFGTGSSVTERMRILSGGNVGIGTTSPDYKLDINSSSTYKTLMLRANAIGTRFDTALEFNAINVSTAPYARIGLQVTSASSGSETAGLTFWTINGGSFSEKIAITSAGNVQITNANPTIDFITNTSTTTTMFSIVGASYVGSAPYNANRIVANNLSHIAFETGGSERMRILSSGNVGIGTTSATNRLSVVGSGNVVTISSSDNSLSLALGYQGTMHGYLGGFGSRVEAYSNNGGYVFLNSSSVWVAASDKKRKRNFEQYNLGLNEILGLKPSLYNMDFQEDGDEKQVGLIAQEVKDHIPLAFEQNDEFIGINYNAIIVTMVNAFKELKSELDIAKQEIAELKLAK